MNSLMVSLDENWLFRARKPHDFTARDIADLAFLYMIGLHILRCEFETAPQAIGYAKMTNSHSGFKTMDRLNTDLYQFLNILYNPNGPVAATLSNASANDVLWNEMKLTPNTVRLFLTNVSAKSYDMSTAKRLLFQIENQLHVTVSNYRSMRRIAVEWSSNEIDTTAQKLVVTRLLQALRAKARRGDLLPWLEKLSNMRRYELFKVCNPETGEDCAAEPDLPSNGHDYGFFKNLAIGAIGAGLIAHAIRKKKS